MDNESSNKTSKIVFEIFLHSIYNLLKMYAKKKRKKYKIQSWFLESSYKICPVNICPSDICPDIICTDDICNILFLFFDPLTVL